MRDIAFAVVTAACLQVTACSSNPTGNDGGGTDVATHVDGTSDSGGGSGALAVNCRDLSNLHDPHCVAPIRPEATMTGTGPRFIGTLDAVHRGFVDGNRVIAPIEHVGGPSVILAVDADTGNRTVISGQYMSGSSMMTVGTGASLPAIFDIQPGPDGWYGLANGAVWRIDPATGNRAKVWDSTTGAHCAFGSAGVMFPVAGIAVGPDGSIYLPVMTTVGADAGIGLVAIHGTTCTMTSHAGYPMAINRGTGGLSDFSQLTFRSGKIWFLGRSQETVGSVDPVTGNRTVLSSGSPAMMVASGPRLGTDSMAFSNDGQTIWTACGADTAYVGIDATSGVRAGRDPYADTPLTAGGPWCTLWAHPHRPLVIVADGNGFTLYDPATGNNNVLSY